MKYTQPELPYANNALEPAISSRTIDFHYGKHEKAYIDNLNNLIEGTEFADLPLEEIIRDSKGPCSITHRRHGIIFFISFHSHLTAGVNLMENSVRQSTATSGRLKILKKNLLMPGSNCLALAGYGCRVIMTVSCL